MLADFANESENCLMTPLVDCESFNANLKLALDKVGAGSIKQNQDAKEFILVHNWDGNKTDGTDNWVDAIEQDELFSSFNAQIRIGGDVFPVTSNPRLTTGNPLTMDVRREAFDLMQRENPKVGPCDFFFMPDILVHAKAILIDDVFAMVGSANATRRSLYTDLEHSISFVGNRVTTDTVADLRCRLWSDHFLHENAQDFIDLETASRAWNSQWGSGTGLRVKRPPSLLQREFPSSDPVVSAEEESMYDVVIDADSTTAWGGFMGLWRLRNK